MDLLIIGAYSRIAQIIEQRILSEDAYKDIDITLLLKNKSRLEKYENNKRVTVIEGDTSSVELMKTIMTSMDMVYAAFADDFREATQNVIEAAKAEHIEYVLSTNSIGLLDDEPNPDFAEYNQKALAKIMPALRESAELYEKSRLKYIILRFAFLNDDEGIKYKITNRNEKMAGTAVSQASVADAILKVIADPQEYAESIIGISDPDTKDIKSFDFSF